MKNKEGGEHHIATDHEPMVQGKLITAHPGSVHGGGEAPEGQSSLRQGAGKRSAGALDLGSAAAAEQRRDREKGFYLRKLHVTGINRRTGAAKGATRCPGSPLARLSPRPRHLAA